MTTNVLQAINRAYNASGINPRGYKTLLPEQVQLGLELFNVILSDKTYDTSLLLYWEKIDGVFAVGQSVYFIERLISVETLTFFLGDGSVRMPTQAFGLDAFMGSARAENTESLPFTYYPNKVKNGTDLYVYFTPDQPYPYQLWGQFELSSVTLFEDLSSKFDATYIELLILQLADRLCIHSNFTVPMSITIQLAKYNKQIGLNGTIQDMSCKSTSSFSRRNYVNWSQVNIGGAYTPGGGFNT